MVFRQILHRAYRIECLVSDDNMFAGSNAFNCAGCCADLMILEFEELKQIRVVVCVVCVTAYTIGCDIWNRYHIFI